MKQTESSRRIRSRQTIFETAFVSSTKSSTEDLDEVDRIANHPVLQSSPDLFFRNLSGMRRSRSEMGGSVDRGVSSFLSRSPLSAGTTRGLSRSTTTCVNLAHFTSPNLPVTPRHPSSHGSSPAQSPAVTPGQRKKTPIRTRVVAIIEGSCGRQGQRTPSSPFIEGSCGRSGQKTSPSNTFIEGSCGRLGQRTTPPSTAPLSKRVMAPVEQSTRADSVRSPLYQEQLRKTISVPAVTASDLTRKSIIPVAGLDRSEHRDQVYRQKNLLKLQTKFLGSKENSACSSVLSSLESVESNTSEVGESVTESMISSSCSSSLELRPPGHNRMSKIINKLQILSPISDKSQEHSSSPSGGGSPGEGEDLTPSSANTNIFLARKKRNVELNLNLNLTESNEGHGISFKTLRTPDIQQYLNVPWDIPKLKSKLKSRRNCFRGQSSSPESSPQKVVLKKSPDVEVILREQSRGSEQVRNMTFSDYSEVKMNKVKTPELEKFLEVPWEVPKLRKKIAHRKNLKTLVNIQGSDSGISMSSQETKDILTIPSWSTGKMRQRGQVYLSADDEQPNYAASAVAEDCVIVGADSDSERSETLRSVPANNEFHFQPRTAGCDYSAYSRAGGDTPVLLSSSLQLQRDTNSQDMKPDLNSSLSISGELSPLPFSMPKLERKLKDGVTRPSLNLSIPSKQARPLSLHSSTPSSSMRLPLQTSESESNLLTPAGLPLARRKPLLFLPPTSIDIRNSKAVDTSIPLESQEWYHGVLSRVEAENILKDHQEGSYLLRANTDYSLSIKSSRGFMHLRISRVEEGENRWYKLGEFDRKFVSIVQMVHHYSINRLPIKGAEHMCLLTPVTEELL